MGCRLLFPAGHSVQFSCSVVSSCLQPFRLKHTRLPCPSPIPRACSKLVSIESVMPSNHLIFCHPLLLLTSIFLNIRVFSNKSALHIRWPKYWSFSFSISPYNEYSDWFPLGWTDWISLKYKGYSRVFSNTTVQKHQLLSVQLSVWSNSHIHTWPMEKPWLWLDRPLSAISMLLNMLSRLVVALLPSSKCLLISWLQSSSVVILEPK